MRDTYEFKLLGPGNSGEAHVKMILPFLVSSWVDVGATEMNSGRGAGLGGVVAGKKGRVRF